MFWKWTKRIGIGLIGTLATLAIAGALYQEISTKVDAKKYPPIGKLVDIGGYKMHIHCTGTGGPTVVLDSGCGGNCLHWSLIQPEIAKFTRVCSFDRAGYGWSDESPKERTCENSVSELHTLLHKSNIPGPYILVGHSLGGLNVRLFIKRYPTEVAGVVLVDSAHEDVLERLQREKIPDPKINANMAMLFARFGLMRLFNRYNPSSREALASFSKPLQDQFLAKISTTKAMRTILNENANFKTSCAQVKDIKGDLGDKPLIVISAAKMLGSEGEKAGLTKEQIVKWGVVWKELQKDLVSKSTKGKQVFADKSDHMVPFKQPEIVVDSVNEMIQSQ